MNAYYVVEVDGQVLISNHTTIAMLDEQPPQESPEPIPQALDESRESMNRTDDDHPPREARLRVTILLGSGCPTSPPVAHVREGIAGLGAGWSPGGCRDARRLPEQAHSDG